MRARQGSVRSINMVETRRTAHHACGWNAQPIMKPFPKHLKSSELKLAQVVGARTKLREDRHEMAGPQPRIVSQELLINPSFVADYHAQVSPFCLIGRDSAAASSGRSETKIDDGESWII